MVPQQNGLRGRRLSGASEPHARQIQPTIHPGVCRVRCTIGQTAVFVSIISLGIACYLFPAWRSNLQLVVNDQERSANAFHPCEDARLKGVSDTIDQIRKRSRIGSISYGIIEHGGLLCADTAGHADWNTEPKRDATMTTMYPLGSISKTFVTAAFGILADHQYHLPTTGALKILTWRDRVRDWLPEFGTGQYSLQDVKIFELLCHTSGLENPILLYLGPNMELTLSQDEFLQILQDNPVGPRPRLRGRPQYTNIGYGILALLVDRIVRQKGYLGYADFLQNEVLAPLKMNNTATDMGQFSPTRFTKANVQLDSGSFASIPDNITRGNNAPALGMVGIRSSLKDMIVWAVAMMDPNGTFEFLKNQGIKNPLRETQYILDGPIESRH